MRVLFTTFAWPSHYFPMVPLAWALRAAGHDVRMTSQPDLLPAMRDSGLLATAVGRDLDVANPPHRESPVPVPAPSVQRTDRVFDNLVTGFAGAHRVHSPDAARRIEDEARSMFRTVWADRSSAGSPGLAVYCDVAEAMVDDLLALARTYRPDLIVYNPLTFAGPIVAKLVGVPAVRNVFAPDATYFMVGDTPGLGALLRRCGLDEVDLIGTSTVDSCPPSLQFPEYVVPTHRIFVRHIPYHGLAEIPQWLSDPPDRPRICLTWGTSNDRILGEKAFLPGELLDGAAKLADERDAELVLAITASQRPLLPDLPTAVRIVESVPLNALLATCDAIIHQGGTGTLLTALRHGLPQLVLPQLLNQPANACRLVASGAGRTLAATGLAAADLVATGHELLDEPAYRTAAQRLQQEILDQPSPADVVGHLVALI